MGALTLLDLEKSVLNLLNEAYNSTAGDLPSGTGSAATIATATLSSTTASTSKALLNEGASEIARTCYDVPETGTLSWTSGTRTNPIASFAPAVTGQILWAVRGVKFGSTALTYADRQAVERHDPAWTTTATGTSTHWYRDGNMSIGLYPKPSTTATVTIDGLAIPKPLSDAADTLAWIPDDLTKLLVWYAASRLALKNFEDESLQPRAAIWQGLYDAARYDLWQQLPRTIQKAHYPTQPIMPK